MIKQITLIIFFKILFINNIYAYNLENNCEKAIQGNNLKAAADEAIKLSKDNTFDGEFCLGKVLVNENKLDDGIKQFEKSEKLAQHPADQMLAIMFKGLAYKEKNDINQAFKVFNNGYVSLLTSSTLFAVVDILSFLWLPLGDLLTWQVPVDLRLRSIMDITNRQNHAFG